MPEVFSGLYDILARRSHRPISSQAASHSAPVYRHHPPQKKTKTDPQPFPICQDRKTRFPSSWTTGPLLQGPDLLFASKPEPRAQEALGHHKAQQGPRCVDTGLPAWAAEGHPSTRSLRSPRTAIPRAPAWQPGGHTPSSRCLPGKAACGVSEEMPTHPASSSDTCTGAPSVLGRVPLPEQTSPLWVTRMLSILSYIPQTPERTDPALNPSLCCPQLAV